jgi:hypothetical protein
MAGHAFGLGGDRVAASTTRRELARGRLARLALCVTLLGMFLGGFPWTTLATEEPCQTPFVVSSDGMNPGNASISGDITVIHDSGLVGSYGGAGRFAGYAIQGTMDNILNTATGMARVQGEFVAKSPDGASSITVWYTGQVDFGAGMAHGAFSAGNGTGDDAGYRAHGTIEGVVTAPATLTGVDVGLC